MRWSGRDAGRRRLPGRRAMRPGLARGVRLTHDHVRDADALLYPEGSLILDGPAGDVVRLCDGDRDLPAVTAALREQYDDVHAEDVTELIADLVERRLLADRGAPAALVDRGVPASSDQEHLAIGLIAELTYRCPLQCAYCSNPVEIDPHD